MRQVMADAAVGDALMGEDPTVNELERKVAQFFGFAFGAFVPSGTMGNQLLLRCQSEPGDALIAPQQNHILRYEAGAAAALAGLQLIPAPLERDSTFVIDAARLKDHCPLAAEFYRPPVTLVAIENTAMDAAGAVYPRTKIEELGAQCQKLGLNLHIDGARIWHALDPSSRSAEWIGQSSSSMSVCLSKGLGAPVGSIALINDEVIPSSSNNMPSNN
jgi:threonine aldolase